MRTTAKHTKCQLPPCLQKHLLKDYKFLQDYIILDIKIGDDDTEELHYSLNEDNQNQSRNACNLSNLGNSKGQNQSCSECFVAQIIGTNQLVKFRKMLVSERAAHRFDSLVQLYQSGVVLADNLFVLQEQNNYYFYIIQAYISKIPQPSLLTHKKPYISISEHSENLSNLSMITPSTRFTTLHSHMSSPNYFQTTLSQKFTLIDKLKILLQCIHQTNQPYIGLNPYKIIIDVEEQNYDTDTDADYNLYFAPFLLEPYVGGGGSFGRAYLAPQMLRTVEKGWKKEKEVKIQELVKADIWAFGCLLMEILFFSSPVFYAVNCGNQIKNIQKFFNDDKNTSQMNMRQCIQILLKGQNEQIQVNKAKKKTKIPQITKQRMVANLLLNCLQTDPQKRILSTQRSLKEQTHPLLEIKNENKKSQPHKISETSVNFPLKVSSSSMPADSELMLTFLQISGIQIEKQLRVNVYLDRLYSVFVDAKDRKNSHLRIEGGPQFSYRIGKTIKIQQNYELLCLILKKPVLVQIMYEGTTYQIYINLETLVMEREGKRIWNKPIIGSYACKQSMLCQDVTIKIKSEIKSQLKQNCFEYIKKEKQIQAKLQQKYEKINKQQKTSNKQNIQKQQIQPIPQQSFTSSNPIKQTPASGVGSYFSDINQSLQKISQKWKQLANKQPINEEQIIFCPLSQLAYKNQNISTKNKPYLFASSNPVSLEVSRLNRSNDSNCRNQNQNGNQNGNEKRNSDNLNMEEDVDMQIDSKIKEMLVKLKIN